MTETYDPGVSIQGRGEAVVLVPGMDGTGHLFYRQTPLLARSYRVATRYDIRDRLHELRRSTLFLAAEQDHLVPSVAQAQYMAARVPGAVMRVLPGHGHICLIAPGVDLEQILDEWRLALDAESLASLRP